MSITISIDGEILSFSSYDDMRSHIEVWLSESSIHNNSDSHVKFEWVDYECQPDINLHREIFESIRGSDISPELIYFDEVYSGTYTHSESDPIDYQFAFSVYMIVTKKYGISLAELYNIDMHKLCPGPCASKILTDETLLKTYFPSPITDEERSQVKYLISRLQTLGYEHNDVHAGNFVVKDAIIEVIDFDLMNRYVKSV